MLIGEYQNTVGEKNRIAVPKKFREVLGTKLIVTRGYEGCMVVVSPSQWEKLSTETATGPFVSSSVRDTTRFLLGGAHEVELDKQGRFVIPSSLMEHAMIRGETSQVVFLGLGRWVEIWEKKKWDERKSYLAKESSLIAEKLMEIKL